MNKTILIILLLVVSQKIFSQNGFCMNAVPDLSDQIWSGSNITAVDLNKDGQMDLVQACGNVVSVLMATGNSTFSSPVFFTVAPSYSNSILDFEIKDVNNDGNLDIVSICEFSNVVCFLTGTGTGNFNAVTTVSTTSSPIALICADLNSDGKPDLATANISPDGVSVYIGQGNGSFNLPLHYSLIASPRTMIVGDFNNVNGPDLLIGTQNNFSYFLKNNGGTTYSISFGFTLPADDIITTDLNSDYKADLIYTDITNGKVVTLKGNGNFTFGSATSYTVPGLKKHIALGDFNNDSKKDLLVSSSYTISIFPGTATGNFLSPLNFSIYVGMSNNNELSGFATIDINNDAKSDIVCLGTNPLSPHTSFKVFVNCNTVGVEELKKEHFNLTLFPTPVQDILNIRCEAGLNEISVCDLQGKIILAESFHNASENITVNTAQIPNGIYLLRVKTFNDAFICKRFVIAH